MRRKLWLIAACIFSFLITLSQVYAAQDSTIIKENAPIQKEPSDKAEVIEYLPMGMEVRISNYPLSEGYYKIRSKTGLYGWIHKRYLSVKPAKEVGDFGFEDNGKKKKKKKKVGPTPERDRRFFVNALGGFSFIRPSDLNDIFRFEQLNTGFHLGGDMGLFLGRIVALTIRFEAILKDVVAKETLSGYTYNIGIRSYPLMVGFDFYFLKISALRISAGIYGGIALGTSFTTEAFNLPNPNDHTILAHSFTSLAKVTIMRPLGRILGVFVEGGYRFLRSPELETSQAAFKNGGQVYLKSGTYQNRVIDLSGAFVSAGVGVRF